MTVWAPLVVTVVFGVTPLIMTIRTRRGQAHWRTWAGVLVSVASLNVAMAVFCAYQAGSAPPADRLWVQPVDDSFAAAANGDWWLGVFLLTPVVSVLVKVAAPLGKAVTPRTVAALGRAQAAAFTAGAELPVVDVSSATAGTFLLPTEPIIALCRRGIAVVAIDPGQQAKDSTGAGDPLIYPPVLVVYVSQRASKATLAAVSRAWGSATAIAPDDPTALMQLQRIGVDPETLPYPPTLDHFDLPPGTTATESLRQSVRAAATIVVVAAGIAETTSAHDAWYRMAAAFDGAL